MAEKPKVIAAPMTALSRVNQKNFKKGGMVKKKMADGGKVTNPYTTKPTATAPTYNRSGSTFTRNTDGTYTQKPIVKAKRGGAMKGKKC
jgi:hypothetical protein